MNKKEIMSQLRVILNKEDVDIDSPVNRKRSAKHESDIEVLLQHVSMLVSYLKFDADSSREELFYVRSLLEEID